MSEPIKVLILEDMPSDAELMQRELHNAGLNFTAVLTDTKEGFVEQLEKFRPDIILSDYGLPSFDGLKALDIVRERSPEMPFIIVSGSIGDELAMDAIRRGASDYILKDRLGRLGVAVERALRDARKRKQLEQAHADIRSLAKFPEENPYPVLRISADGILLYANPGSKLLMDFWGIKPGVQVHETYSKHIKQALSDHKKIEIEVACGETVYLLTLSPVHENQYVNVDGRDITERKRAEEALRKSEEFNRAIISHAPIGIAVRDRERRLISCNDTWAKLWGMREPDIARHRQPLDAATFRQYFQHLGPDLERVLGLFEKPGSVDIPELHVLEPNPGGAEWIMQHFYTIAAPGGGVDQVITITEDITDRKRAEETIRFMARALESINECVTVSDLENRITFVNETFLSTYGYRRDEVIGRTAEFVMVAGSGPLLPEITEATRQGGWRGELRNRRKDGSEFPILLSTAPVRDDSGAIIGLMGVTQDITERKRAEDAVRASEEKYRDIFNNSVEGIYKTSVDGRYLVVNHSFAQMFGYDSPEEMIADITDIGQQEYVDPDDRKRLIAQLNGSEGLVRAFEVQLRRKDGSLFWVSINARSIPDGEGAAAFIEGTCTDITERKRAEEELQESQARYQAIFEATGTATMIVEEDTTIVMANSECLPVTGYTPREIIGTKWPNYVAPESLDLMRKNQVLRRAAPGKAPQQYEASLINKAGETRYAMLDIGMIPNTKQSVVSMLDITERKQAEQTAKVSEQRYRIFVNSTADMAFLKDDQMRYLMVNEANCAFFGLAEDQIVGKTDFDLMPQENALACRRTDLLAMEKDRVAVSEETVGGKNYESRKFPVRLDNGKTGVGGFIRDITEHKRADAALRASEERLRSFVDNTFIGIYRTTPDGKILMANPSLINLLGYASFEDLAQRDLQHEGYEPGYERDEFKRLMEQAGQVIGHETPWKRKDGSVVWVRENARCIRNAGGAIQYYEGTVEDITSRRKAEKDLLESESKYRKMVETINDVIFSMDTAGVVTYISPAMERIVKYKTTEIIGQPFARFIHPDDLAAASALITRNLDGIAEPAAYRIVDKDGVVKYVHSVSYQVMEQGTVIGITGTLTDYTEQHQMELEKSQVENNLRQAQKMEAIGQLAGGVAHDFNNMLAGMMGNAELLYKKLAANPEQAELIERILKAGEHAANLTKQLLSFARKGQYQMVAVDIHRSIASMAGILASTIDRRIKIRQDLRARSATIIGDPTQIENALMNLALNARDAMPTGGELTFGTDIVEIGRNDAGQHQVGPGRYIMISVTDTGTGISEEVRKHIFEPFFTTKEPGRGTGLGLASVYGIAKNHQGAIEVDSTPGQGTVMKVYLPLADASQAALAPPAPASVQSGTESLLLVDDEPMIREMAGQMLRGMGYTVATCSDGQEAVDYYREHHAAIDLVILDMIMPRLNGREAFLQMRQIDPGVRVLLASGFSADGEAQEVLKLGIRGFIQKPFRMAELSGHIQDALGHAVPQSGA